MTENDIESLKNQLSIARNEINKLRQQVKSLQYVHRKDIECLQKMLEDFRCEGCKLRNLNENCLNKSKEVAQDSNAIAFKPIGVIRTAFPEKRAVPRQSTLAGKLRGIIDINPDVFTNPEHSLQGLQEFSHLWVIYHFHRNNSHSKTKVAPPRLGGEKVGVFSTRSPHRPCPIGLSLVEINKIEGSIIYFSGTDMVDETPVLDIKPYIPFYDSPFNGSETSGRLSVGQDIVDFYNSRQEPDGEESDSDINGAVGNSLVSMTMNNYSNTNNHQITTSVSPLNPDGVKVPNWIINGQTLSVTFNERAESQMRDLKVDRQSIINVLETDPRSVYLRTKYGSQIFTFQLSEVTVTCKFDDKISNVTVVQVRRTENVQDENY
ncbi:uncharacterized protein LOC129610876 [Condylostylus longicornis]|uniref:uncharacterized protein LOC129610876 n=1 Tax=Condylostylus longicornis TaxID=2530218 RepID=UPI00244DB92E|nr:uncharacterized protein LOC129610876 [Condylostylus longicornis]